MSSFDKSGSAVKASVAAGALAVALVLALQSPTLLAQPAVQGQWRTLANLMPINPIHLTLTNDGRVLVVAGSGNDANVNELRRGGLGSGRQHLRDACADLGHVLQRRVGLA